MKLKYYGTSYENGLTLKIDMFNSEGIPAIQDIVLTETVLNSCVYISEDILQGVTLKVGVYVSRVKDSKGVFLGFDEIIFNGVREITLLELKFMTELELMQLRDALGIDGDKAVASRGQLQKKSEEPYNKWQDTNDINKVGR